MILRMPAIFAAFFLVPAAWDADAWKPAPGPLATRWAKDVSPASVHPEYPRPQMVRPDWQSLNGLWEFEIAGPDTPPPFGRTLPDRILVPFPIESSLSGVGKRAERVWYRRTFQVPDDWHGRRVLLHFGAVDWESVVYINHVEVGRHRGGYDPFTLDITDALTADEEHELVIDVFDPTSDGDQPRGKQVNKPKGIWYTPSTGIWQSVWMEPVSPIGIRRLTLTPDIGNACLRVGVEAMGARSRTTVTLVASQDEKPVATATGGVGAEILLEIPAKGLRLWSPADPYLYDLTVTLKQGETVVDRVTSYFGMREIGMGRDSEGRLRLTLNDEPLFQMGVLDQGFWPDGLYTAPTDEALRFDIEATRRLGFNMSRKHVKVEPARWYYWCDRLGLLVWQDMPSGNNGAPEAKEQFERELTSIIAARRNHPSIVMWVVFNEGWGQHDTDRYVDVVRRLDPSRLINAASGWHDRGVGDVLDIHAYPGPNAPEPDPRRASVLGEFGGLGLAVPEHTWSEESWSYRGVQDSIELTNRYQSLLRRVWQLEQQPGLTAAVYTQLTDVEYECNGLLTYDRAVMKVNDGRVSAANRGLVPKLKTIVPTALTEPPTWRYTLKQPQEEWIRPGFDDSAWRQGRAGFGTPATPGARIGTPWNSEHIWLRREFESPAMATENLWLFVHHDEDVEVYINGVLALAAGGYTIDYQEMPIRPEGRAALKAGKNTLAVHCRQTKGGQYIDVGLVELQLTPEK